MKILLIRTKGVPQVPLRELEDYLRAKLGTEIDWTLIESPVDPPRITLKNYGPADGIDPVPFVKQAKGYDWLIVLWKANGRKTQATTGYAPDEKLIVTQIGLDDASDFFRQASHELMHGLCGYMSTNHVQDIDVMDYRLQELGSSHEFEPYHPEGNREKVWYLLRPYMSQLQARFSGQNAPSKPLGPPTKVSLLEKLVEALQSLLELKTDKPLKVPNGYAEIVATFGNPLDKNFERDNIVSFVPPIPLFYAGTKVSSVRCHKLMVPIFKAVLQELKDKGLDKHVRNYGGIYNQRLQRTGNVLSAHSWGVAFDAEPVLYPLGGEAKMPKEVVDVWKKYGFVCGEDFKVNDAGHYQFATGY